MWVDSDLARVVANKRSVTSLIHEYNGVAFAWKSKKKMTSLIARTEKKFRHISWESNELYNSEDSKLRWDHLLSIQLQHKKIMIQ